MASVKSLERAGVATGLESDRIRVTDLTSGRVACESSVRVPAGSTLNRIIETTKPEAVYFTGLQPVCGKMDRLKQFCYLVLALCGILAISSVLFL